LLAVMDHTSRAVLAQADVEATTNEIARFRPLLEGLDLADTVVTADALHTQRGRARRLAGHRQARRLPADGEGQPAHPAPAAAYNRGHWGIEICQADCACGM
jgi:predicted transposase YbfD/YdcC